MCCTFAVTFITRFVWTPLNATVSEELGLTAVQAGAFMSAFFVGYVITQIPGGYLADRIGVKWVLSAGILLSGVASLGMAYITSYGPGFVLRVITGLGGGVFMACATKVIADNFPNLKERGIAFGILQVGATVPLMGFLLEPEAMHGLIDAITDYKLTYLQLIVENVHPDAIISHDDWGTQTSLFFSKAVWEEFFKEPYRKLYGYLKENNVIVIHHSDSFLEPIAGEFKSIGIDVWQGVIPSNHIVRLGQELKGSLGLMGGIDSIIDMKDWSQETIHAEVWRACDAYKDVPGYWPGMTYGGPGALFPGVYDAVAAEISRYNLEHFGVDPFR